ncbi:universal stress protein UspA [Halobiforma lacisalsi AJ5]|uniref:Universal stress protein UspA n=1 Tax=Natronobacterium lacisalsi AJ5 TaxID=358396 RepID=M0LPU4_NATLA|nr:universal stress protein [Halobiforma lacisalsi]APW99631.1 universal stress protein UspA [Halobiforma lacisalsi AJ5]EMA35582.1 UspA domain-containing protein [Halobiforma lacisalsi AJ5]
MYDLVLVPVDGSDAATAALEHALEIATDHGATIHLLYVADTNRPSLTRQGQSVVDALEREGEEVIADAREVADKYDVAVVDDVVQGDPRSVILEFADSEPADLVVMGTHGHRPGKYVLGSVTEGVVHETETPVLAVRADDDVPGAYPYDGVLVPTDGSDLALAAVRRGSELAARHDASVTLLSVVDEPALGIASGVDSIADRLADDARDHLAEAATVASDAGADEVATEVEFGSPPREIRSRAAEPDVDLVVMGTHGRTGLEQRLLGSVTERVLRTAPVPVLVAKPKIPEE